MTRKPTRNSPLRVVAFFVGVLSLLIAVAVLAQVRSTDRTSGEANAVLAQLAVPASPLAEFPLTPRTDGAERFPTVRSHAKGQRAVPMDSNWPPFVAVVPYDSGGAAVSVAVADVNGDGKPDLLTANYDNGTVGVLLGNGDGTFQVATTFDAGGPDINTYSIAVGDLNGDGKPDVAVTVVLNGSSHYPLRVLMGNGDGTFQPAVAYDTGTNGNTYSVVVADVNGDNKPDLVVVNEFDVSILLGNGDGTFQTAVTYNPGVGPVFLNSAAVVDVNGDDKPDLIVSAIGIDKGVLVLLGNGDGTFQTPAKTYGFEESHWNAVGDVNGDGKPDVAFVDNHNNPNFEAGVILGNGDGTFRSGQTYDTGGEFAVKIVMADVNGDGNPDLLVANIFSNSVSVLFGNGDGTFQAPLASSSGGASFGIAVADVNGDNKPDLLVADQLFFDGSGGGIGVLLNNSGAPPTTTTLASSLNPADPHEAVTYTAAVTSQHGGGLTGFVMFQDGGSTVANVRLAGDQAAYSTMYSKGGTHAITATYSGDLQNAGSASATLIEHIAGIGTKTAVTSSGSPSLINKPVTFTAIVSSPHRAIPDGELVTFYDGTAPLGSVALAGGTAAFTTSRLSPKEHTIRATYAGDATFKPSTGSVTQVVNKHPTTTSLRSSLNPSAHGQAVTFISRVASAGPIPTGKVVFKDGTLGIGSATLISGVAKLTKSALAVGTHPITAQYLGDAVSGKSTSAVLNQVVK
jgi:hypothetical protein